MSAPIDVASQGGASGASGATVASPEVEIQRDLSQDDKWTPPPSLPAVAATPVATAAPPPPSAGSSVSSRASKRGWFLDRERLLIKRKRSSRVGSLGS